MRRLALFALCAVSLTGCAFPFWDRPPFITSSDPYAPPGDTENMRRARGQPVAVQTLGPVGGNMWPGPIPKTPSMADLVKLEGQGQNQLPTVPPQGPPSQPSAQSAQPYVIPPVPEAAGPPAPEASSGPNTGQVVQTPTGQGVTTGGTSAFKTLTMPNGQTGILVPNGNGTSTIIMSNGQVQTVPAPK
jgi:hypothetical protein